MVRAMKLVLEERLTERECEAVERLRVRYN